MSNPARSLRIAIFGQAPFGKDVMVRLLEDGHAIVGVFVPPDDEEGAPDAAAPERARDVVLAVTFSRLGPVRAELSLQPGALAVRVLTPNEELVARLRSDFDELAQRLGDGRRAVHLSARVAELSEVAVIDSPLDIQFLREHRLLDVSG